MRSGHSNAGWARSDFYKITMIAFFKKSKADRLEACPTTEPFSPDNPDIAGPFFRFALPLYLPGLGCSPRCLGGHAGRPFRCAPSLAPVAAAFADLRRGGRRSCA